MKTYLHLRLGWSLTAILISLTFGFSAFSQETEPNNSADEANAFQLNSTITATIENYTDQDWFKVVTPQEGILKFISTGIDINYYYLWMMDVDGITLLMTTSVYPLGETDSVFQINLQAGTYYIKVSQYNIGSYTLTNQFTPALLPGDPEPNDTFETGTPLAVNTEVTGRLNYVYDHTYDNQDWYRIIVPKNGGLKITSWSEDNWYYYVWLYDVNGLSLLVYGSALDYDTCTITGTNLVEGATYFLRIWNYSTYCGSYTLATEFLPAPTASFTSTQNLMRVLFDNTSQNATSYNWVFGDGSTSSQVNPSHAYMTPGVYNITLTASNQYGNHQAKGYAEFRGIQRIEGTHGGNSGKATITTFAGGIKSQSVPYLRMGSNEIQGEQILFPGFGQIQASFNLDGVALGVYDMVVKNPGESEMILEKVYTVEQAREPEVWVEVNGRSKGLINRWCTWSVDIGNRGNTDAFYRILWLAVPDSVRFTNLAFDLSLFNDPESEEYLEDCPPYWELDTLGTEPFNGRLYGIMLNKIPADSKFNIEFQIKTSVDFEIVAFSTTPWFTEDDYSRTMSYHECVAWAVAVIIRDKLVEQLTDLIPGSDCIYNSIKSLSEVTLAYYSDKLTVPSGCWAITQLTWKCLKDLGHVLPWWEAYEVAWTITDLVMDIIEAYNADSDCQDYKKKEVKKKVVKAVTSYDPNEIEGPQGFTDSHCIRDREAPYTIFFENKSTATSNAIEVFITDVVSSATCDLETFRFEKVWIAGNPYEVLMDGDGFACDVDLRPRLNTVVRVNGTFDRSSGEAYWHFMSLDPSTMNLTEDPEAGFLPPNVDRPEGEGAVAYVVELKPDLGHGDQIAAQASIVFDFNEPILTNTFTNVVDLQPPSGSVYDIQPAGGNGLVEIFWQATDNGAGVDYFNIYRSVGSGEFTLWRNNMEASSDTMTAVTGTSYKFFSQAVDNLGNEEPYKGYAEKVLGIQDGDATGLSLEILPNPASSRTLLRYQVTRPLKLSIEIFNYSGQKVYQSGRLQPHQGELNYEVDVSNWSSGVYAVILRTDSGIATGKLMVTGE